MLGLVTIIKIIITVYISTVSHIKMRDDIANTVYTDWTNREYMHTGL